MKLPAILMFCCLIKQEQLHWETGWLQNLFRQKAFTEEQLADAAQLASLADETPEGRSIVVLAKEQFNIRAREMQSLDTVFIPFTAQTSMSGIDFRNPDGQLRSIRKGSAIAIRKFIENNNGFFPKNVEEIVSDLSRQGATPLVVAENNQVLGSHTP